MSELTVVLEGYSFLEGPRWREGRLWLSDFYTHQVVSLEPDGSDLRLEATVPAQPSGLGWLPDGRLLVVSMKDHRVLRREPSGELVEHADLSGRVPGPLNDMIVDGTGRAYVGNFGFDIMTGGAPTSTSLLRVEPDGMVAEAAEALYFPNGAVFLPDGRLVVAETLGHRLSVFDVGRDGGLSDRRDWATFGALPTAGDLNGVLEQLTIGPDGIALDTDGAIWVADALGTRVVRVAEGGEILQEISTGDTSTYAVALGGDDRRTLFLCTAPGFAEHERSVTREGTLLAVRVDVPGA